MAHPSSPECPEPRGRRKPAASRAQILEAVQALILSEGVDGVTIRRVSEGCGYSAPTIYHHFGDKNGLIDAVLEERFQEAFAVMSAIPKGDDPQRYLREMARAFVAFALANPDHYQLLSTPRLARADDVPSAEATRELVKGALKELAESGRLATRSIETAYQVTWVALHGLISLSLIRPNYDFDEDLVETTLDVMEAGLMPRGSSAS